MSEQSVVVVDAPASVQQWVNSFSTTLPVLTGQDHVHPPKTVVITLSQLWRVVEATKRAANDIDPWSIAESGLPPIPANPSNPSPGNWLHNAWHAMGG